MKRAVDRVCQLLHLKFHDPTRYKFEIEFEIRYTRVGRTELGIVIFVVLDESGTHDISEAAPSRYENHRLTFQNHSEGRHNVEKWAHLFSSTKSG